MGEFPGARQSKGRRSAESPTELLAEEARRQTADKGCYLNFAPKEPVAAINQAKAADARCLQQDKLRLAGRTAF